MIDDPREALRKRLTTSAMSTNATGGSPLPPPEPDFGPVKPANGPLPPPVPDIGPPQPPKPPNGPLPTPQPTIGNPVGGPPAPPVPQYGPPKATFPIDPNRGMRGVEMVNNAMPVGEQGTAVMPGRQFESAPAAAPAAAGGGGDKGWLDWINATYGQSKSRGTGFSDLPQGVTLEQAIGRYNAETGAGAKYIGGPSGDRVDFGEGVTDALTAGGQLWSDYGAMSGQARNGASTGGAPATGGASAGGGAAAGVGAGAGDDRAAVRAMLMEQLKAASGPIDPNSGGIGEAMTGARLEADRASQMERSALAERRAANGDTSGSLEMGIQQSAERNAVGLGGLRAKLIQQEYTAQRQKFMDLMQLATASGDAQSAREIQMKLSELDAAVRREGLGLDAAKYEAYLNQDAAKAGLNG